MKQFRKIYFVGIKGVGMTGLAILAKEAGFLVSGSDTDEHFITDLSLEKCGIRPLVGFNPLHLKEFIGTTSIGEVLVITTGAHGGFDNPESSWAQESGITLWTHGRAVGEFMKGEIFGRSFEGISIAGTHGKTTISAMFATYLSELSWDPSYAIGTSEIFPLGLSGHFGKGRHFIAEADEYVSDMQYDRVAKFLYQKPQVAVINNIDFDHPDFFKDITAVEEVYDQFLEGVSENGMIFINGDTHITQKLAQKFGNSVQVITYGMGEECDIRIGHYYQNGFTSFFTVDKKDISLGEFSLSVPGFHNAKNSLPAILFMLESGVPVHRIQSVLPTFKGTKRRMEQILDGSDLPVVIDDYAHHPEEIKKTLSAVKSAFPDKKHFVIFQPHTYSRTRALITDFACSFTDANTVILLPIFASAREQVDNPQAINNELVEAFQKISKDALFLKDKEAVVEYVSKNLMHPENVIITMGAGDVYKVAEQLKQ